MKKEENIVSSEKKEEKVKVQKVKEEKTKKKIPFNFDIRIAVIVAAVVLVIIGVIALLSRTKVDTITKVKKVAGAEYYSVECLNETCDYIMAAKGNRLGKSKIYIFDANGKKVAKFKDSFFNQKDYTLGVSDVSKNYIILKKVNKTTNETAGYLLTNTKGKGKYSTGNNIFKINDYLVSEYDSSGNAYLIINSKGKILYNRVSRINKFANGKVVSLSIGSVDTLINENGETILNGYVVSKEVISEDNETLYLILADSKANAYYYYNIDTNKIVGDGFNGYVSSDKDGELIITRRENNANVKYRLSASGKQTKMTDDTVTERVEFIKDKLGSDYALYVSSVVNVDQRHVFVNRIKDSSFGVYDVDSGKYNKMYNYSSDEKSTSITNLESSDNKVYMQTTCYKGYCDKVTTYIYDLSSNKELFKLVGEDLLLQKFAEYTNGYKVVKYSSNSSNVKYSGKYVLYDSKNKEVIISSNTIIPVGEENLFGESVSSRSLILYSTKIKKVLNSDDYLGSKITVSGSYVYKFSDDENTYLFSDKGKLLVSIKSSDAKLLYSDETIVYLLNNKANIIDPTTGRTRKYSLKKNERINDISGDTIPPYRNSLFVNNTVSDYVKVVNVKGRTLKKIKGVEIKEVVKNEKTNNVVIIVKKLKNNNNLYGVYIAK